jgi:pyruvate kinase
MMERSIERADADGTARHAGNAGDAADLIAELERIRAGMLALEASYSQTLPTIPDAHRESARNLIHYLALRGYDLRPLQARLARQGLSSLGRSEAHVLATVDAVLSILDRLAGSPGRCPAAQPALGFRAGVSVLARNTRQLLGVAPRARDVRIMVTMPSEAATNYALVHDVLAAGMDIMRINCAHDHQAAWGAMVAHLRRAEAEVGRACAVCMDLGGPKLRTGPLAPGPAVLKWRPRRDTLGRVTAPARIWLTAAERPRLAPAPAAATLPMPASWLGRLRSGARITFRDTRHARRSLRVVAAGEGGCWAESAQTAYVAPGLRLRLRAHEGRRAAGAPIGGLPATEQPIVLRVGDTLLLTRELRPGHPAVYNAQGRLVTPAAIGCTLPAVFAGVCPGERIWLDDGKIGGVIRAAGAEEIEVEITQAGPGGSRLRADKGINLPDSTLRLPSLTEQDIQNLPFIVARADLLGYSFVRSPEDVVTLQSYLAALGATRLGIVLKIETRAAFEALPGLLLAAMRSDTAGVMIARGDLAVECGYERLAELQEEILCVAEAAHMPVIWATQVLERLAQTGMPSRAEISDAAMGERAECVMLNKGPHAVEAVRVLDSILRRMQDHQSKKSAMLRRLRLAGDPLQIEKAGTP